MRFIATLFTVILAVVQVSTGPHIVPSRTSDVAPGARTTRSLTSDVASIREYLSTRDLGTLPLEDHHNQQTPSFYSPGPVTDQLQYLNEITNDDIITFRRIFRRSVAKAHHEIGRQLAGGDVIALAAIFVFGSFLAYVVFFYISKYLQARSFASNYLQDSLEGITEILTCIESNDFEPDLNLQCFIPSYISRSESQTITKLFGVKPLISNILYLAFDGSIQNKVDFAQEKSDVEVDSPDSSNNGGKNKLRKKQRKDDSQEFGGLGSITVETGLRAITGVMQCLEGQGFSLSLTCFLGVLDFF